MTWMLHDLAQLWQTVGIYVGLGGTVCFLPTATEAMQKRRHRRAAGSLLLAGLFWGLGVGPSLFSWLMLLCLAAFTAGLQALSRWHDGKKNRAA